MLQTIMLCRLAITIDFIGALIKPMLLHKGEVSALKEFRMIFCHTSYEIFALGRPALALFLLC